MQRRLFLQSAGLLSLGTAGLRGESQAVADSHPVRILVPFAAGGPSDQVARSLAQALSGASGRTVLVENRPGADGIVAARAALGAPHDGATLLYAPSSLVGVGQLAKPPLDLASDFTAVSGIGHLAFAMFTTAQLPVQSVAEFVELARSHPGQLNFATSTGSELMAAHQFMRATGIRMERVPYKGASQALPDLLEGRVQVMFGPVSAGLPHVDQGKLKLLATLLPSRSPLAPQTPTIAEAGYASVRVPTWQALFAPGTPGLQVVQTLAQQCAVALSKPELRAEFESRALLVEALGPKDMHAVASSDRGLWAQLIREYHLEAS
ncbi:Bug family tripartite tricarboxylate transporter substrate binding protein [Ramlibacter sp. MMS24-I3-19]|uniref:Bug family tripartite tricarboxylate transporter substrate binding protein n=1 Tax=Ramlibacter sp. MMS24-I3-19 TaxID=3416606 RepID=UPI003D054F8E